MARIQKIESDSSFANSNILPGTIMTWKSLEGDRIKYMAKKPDGSVVEITPEVDFSNSNYYTKDEVNGFVQQLSDSLGALRDELQNDYYDKQQIDEIVAELSTSFSLSNYYTKSQINQRIDYDIKNRPIYVKFSSVAADNTVTFNGYGIPVGLVAPSGAYYTIEKSSVEASVDTNISILHMAAYLAYENMAQFSGTWKACFPRGLGQSQSGLLPGDKYYTREEVDQLLSDSYYTKVEVDQFISQLSDSLSALQGRVTALEQTPGGGKPVVGITPINVSQLNQSYRVSIALDETVLKVVNNKLGSHLTITKDQTPQAGAGATYRLSGNGVTLGELINIPDCYAKSETYSKQQVDQAVQQLSDSIDALQEELHNSYYTKEYIDTKIGDISDSTIADAIQKAAKKLNVVFSSTEPQDKYDGLIWVKI